MNIPLQLQRIKTRIGRFNFVKKIEFFIEFIRLFHIPKTKHTDNRKVLIICFHLLGDAVLTIRAIKYFVERFNNFQITIACYEEHVDLYREFLPSINFLSVSQNDFLDSKKIKRAALKKIVQIDCNTLIDLTGSIRTVGILLKVNANYKIGINENPFAFLYTQHVPYHQGPKISDNYLDVVKAMGIEVRDSEIAEARLNKNIRILIHPFAGWEAKEWNLEKFNLLADYISSRFAVAFVVASEKDCEKLNASKHKIIITKSTKELIEELKNSSLLISNDTGPIHLAAELGIATFTIYGPTNPLYHLPEGSNHAYVQNKIECVPTSEKYCYTYGGLFCHHLSCMKELSAQRVIRELTDFMNKIELNIQPEETLT